MLPLLAGYLTRRSLVAKGGETAIDAFKTRVQPFSIVGLLVTVVLLFGFQGEVILDRPLVIVLIVVPLLIQSYGIFFVAHGAARAWSIPFNVAAPCALIGTSNFFELAVAVAISLFGLGSGAALATVVGVLIEVLVMLSLFAFANRTGFPRKGPHDRRHPSQSRLRHLALRAGNHRGVGRRSFSRNRLDPPAASGAVRRRRPYASHRPAGDEVPGRGAGPA